MCIMLDWKISMFRIDATMMPTTPMIRKTPQPDMSRFVVYP